jgi:CDP-glucose 4,6-dehydratase
MVEGVDFMNILVTGGNGLIGSYVVRDLLEKKHNVTVLYLGEIKNSILTQEDLCDKVNLISGDIVDYKTVERVINYYEIDFVIHLAAQTIVKHALNSPMDTFETNIKGTWNVLEACRQHSKNIKGIIIASSDKAYGELKKEEYLEDDELKGIGPYDVSKSCTDLISQSYSKVYNLPLTISRCGNVYGPGDINFSRLIPGTILSILKNETPIIRSDGKFIRDYNYVEDISAGYIALLDYTLKNKPLGEAFNFSNDDKMNVLDVVKIISKKMNFDKEPKILNEAKNEIVYQHLNSSKAKKILNWKCNYSFDKGIEKTIKWYKKYYGD